MIINLLLVHWDKFCRFWLNKKMDIRDSLPIISSLWIHDKSLTPCLHAVTAAQGQPRILLILVLESPLNPMAPHAILTFLLTENTGQFSVSRLPSFETLWLLLAHISIHCWNTLNPAALLPPEDKEPTSVNCSLFYLSLLEPFGQHELWGICERVLFENWARELLSWYAIQNPLSLVQIQPSPRHEISASCQNCSPY